MAWDIIDKFTSDASSALVGHAPDTGTTAWSSSASWMYSGSIVKLVGDGYTFNSRAGSSLILWPGTYVGTAHVVRASLKFRSHIGGVTTSGIGLCTPALASVDNRFYYNDEVQRWELHWGTNSGTQWYNSSYTFPAANTVVEVRLTVTEAASRTILCEYSTDAGTTWTTLFGGVKSYTADANAFAPSIWYDGQNTLTTGVHVGNLRVGTSGTTPTLSVTPTPVISGSGVTLSLEGTGTGWRTSAPTFTVSGGTGASLGSATVSDFDSATIVLTPGSTAGTLTITDPAGGTAPVVVALASTFRSANVTIPPGAFGSGLTTLYITTYAVGSTTELLARVPVTPTESPATSATYVISAHAPLAANGRVAVDDGASNYFATDVDIQVSLDGAGRVDIGSTAQATIAGLIDDSLPPGITTLNIDGNGNVGTASDANVTAIKKIVQAKGNH